MNLTGACRGKEGRELLEECLMIIERHKGKEDPSSATHLINLATSHSRSKNYVEAERLLRASLRILAKTVGPDEQSITFPMLHLAVTLYHLKRDEEDEQLALEALRIREKAFGKGLPSRCGGSRLFGVNSNQINEGRRIVTRSPEEGFEHPRERVRSRERGGNDHLEKNCILLGQTREEKRLFPLQKRLSALRLIRSVIFII
ncbi:kinesin light chain-like [Pyrus x bretschneideri]|uniref:kinesin light chain-like n=1 Tax=Pyrus x bretschneideri TaxID=225117 RepID=UPI0008706799|nr:kinesin light chain-like [Pyrus x bretschneideri]